MSGLITPYLTVHDAAAAIAFYGDVFGAVCVGEAHQEGGKIGFVQLRAGDAAFMLSDEFPEHDALSPVTLGGSPVSLTIQVSSLDAVVMRAIEAGGALMRPIREGPAGRIAKLRDPFGHVWFLSGT